MRLAGGEVLRPEWEDPDEEEEEEERLEDPELELLPDEDPEEELELDPERLLDPELEKQISWSMSHVAYLL